MPKAYSPEFPRKVLDLLDAGRKVADVAADLGVTQQTIYNWRRQHLIDSGRMPGVTSSDHVELAHDEPTADLLTQRLQVHEKTAWMLRSLLT